MKRKGMQGAAVVEFALVFPLFLALFFGMVVFSIALYDKAVITNAAREAARAGIVLSNPKKTVAQIQAVALSYCSNYLITFGTPVTNVTVTGAGGTFGTALTVTVSYQYSGFLWSGQWSPTLTATVVMNNE